MCMSLNIHSGLVSSSGLNLVKAAKFLLMLCSTLFDLSALLGLGKFHFLFFVRRLKSCGKLQHRPNIDGR